MTNHPNDVITYASHYEVMALKKQSLDNPFDIKDYGRVPVSDDIETAIRLNKEIDDGKYDNRIGQKTSCGPFDTYESALNYKDKADYLEEYGNYTVSESRTSYIECLENMREKTKNGAQYKGIFFLSGKMRKFWKQIAEELNIPIEFSHWDSDDYITWN